jgi:hypothetical protein
MIAFCAAEELSGRFIAASSLHLPNVNQHVAAFGALHPHSWHGVHFLVFFTDNRHLLLHAVLYDFAAYLCVSFVSSVRLHVAAFRASQNDRAFSFFRNQSRTAVGTELHTETPLLWIVIQASK